MMQIPTENHPPHNANRIGVLLTNLGTPSAPTTNAVRRYLKEFLWDARVVELPRALWWLVLNGIILPLRSPRSAKLYQKVWTPAGSPLLNYSRQQQQALQQQLGSHNIKISLAMRYGEPSIEQGLQALQEQGIEKLLIFPLYPQYSATTTASTFDAVSQVLKRWRWLPEIRMINHYADDANYIAALATSIETYWRAHGRAEKLIFSFHGIPQKYFDAGDPYYCYCQKTARLVAEKLQLAKDAWQVCFQSRFGRGKWLQPATDTTLVALAKQGVKKVAVVCPGFSVDCLETLEEIQIRNRDFFLNAGGVQFEYIPALNASEDHIKALAALVEKHTQGWGSLQPKSRPKNTVINTLAISTSRGLSAGSRRS